MGRKALDLIGKKFGRLTVLERAPSTEHQVHWLCQCECGGACAPRTYSLTSGHTTSCGCYISDRIIKQNTKHGGFGTRLYNIWQGMKKRCYIEKEKDYNRYGGRGISICSEWKDDFGAFQDWAFSNGYSDELSIDRVDNDGNYEPSNCRWATLEEQNNNKRSNVFLTANGERHTIAEWGRLLNIDPTTIGWRLGRGWTTEEALEFTKRNNIN